MTKLLPVILAGLLASLASRCPAAEPGNATAYTALRLVGKTLGADALNRVVEVTGRAGAPQPTQWRIVVREGESATREIKVSGGRIVSQEVVRQPSSLPTVVLQDLNLDSSGAFDVADAQARKAHVRFDSLNYSLRVNATTGKPVWDLELINGTGAHVGGVRLAAHDGGILAVNGLVSGQPVPPAPTPAVAAGGDHDTVRPARVPPSRRTTTTTTVATVQTTAPTVRVAEVRQDEARPDEGGFFARAGQTMDHTTRAVGDTFSRAGDTVNHGARRAGATVQRFFTGHSDLDR